MPKPLLDLFLRKD